MQPSSHPCPESNAAKNGAQRNESAHFCTSVAIDEIAGSEKRKGGGMGTSIGIGIALSFSYILFQTVSASFAVNGGWPPMLAAWIPNILFAGIAFYLYKRTPQ